MSELATPASTAKVESQLVTFYLGDEEFGFDIMSVQEIIRQPKLSRIPMAPLYVEGIANLRGMVLPIIDTRTRFGMARTEDTDRTRVLVVDVDGNRTGLRVDRVRQVTRVLQKQMEPPPPVIREGITSDYLESVVKLDDGKRIIMSLNPRSICKVSPEVLQQYKAALGNETTATTQQAKEAGEDLAVVQLVAFKLGREEFAFQMDRVREILRVSRPSEVPGTPKHVLGVLTVRGNVLPVIDLRVMLGLSNLESEVAAEVTALSAGFKTWLTATGERVRAGGKLDASGAETVRKWMVDCTTSSEALLEVLSQMRTANDRLLRGIAQTQSLGATDPDKARTLFEQEIETSGQEVLKLLGEFQHSVKENIREDQRLIVVQAYGSLLALLVDKVREVLKMPKRQIDIPPAHLSESQNVELSGIAKLENGKRLIMLLDASHLIKQQDLEQFGASGGQPLGSETQKHQIGDESVALGEQQFVTFYLGDGEFGVPIAKIQEIDRAAKMTRVPRAAEYMDGITNLRGEVVPVINARRRFNLPARETDERTRVMIMELGGVKTGLLVDSVHEVLNLASKDIAPPPASLSTTVDRQFISGIGKVDGDKRMLILLEVEKIIQR